MAPGSSGMRGGSHVGARVTDDPLAAIEARRWRAPVYAVSRSVLLPRVAIRPGGGRVIEGINPIYTEESDASKTHKPELPLNTNKNKELSRHSPSSAEQSSSSGYGGSQGKNSLDQIYIEHSTKTQPSLLLEQNPLYVKSIKVIKPIKSTSTSANSSGSSTLNTIPEGKIDSPVPKPIWPFQDEHKTQNYDSLVDDVLLRFTSFNPNATAPINTELTNITLRDILLDLVTKINTSVEGRTDVTPEQMLKIVNERLLLGLEVLRTITEEEMRKLCVNLSNSKKISSVVRAFSHSSSSGNSSQSSPEWNKPRLSLSEADDFYQIPSASSSSGFSDSVRRDPVFLHDNVGGVPNCLRNAMIYGTLCRGRIGSVKEVEDKETGDGKKKKKSLLQPEDNRPSVWEQYYGVRAVKEQGVGVRDGEYVAKPTDVPVYPLGRPEADFTLDISRSELLSKRMKDDKRWRLRCRVLTSFLGLVFFLLSVMVFSLLLTKGKRMFGSMV